MTTAPAEPSGRMDQLNVRRSNLSLVLQEVLRSPRSRAQIAADTQMTRGTVSSLVAELEARGLVQVADATASDRVGRRGHTVNVVPERVLGLGVSLSVHYLVGALVDLTGAPVARFAEPIQASRSTPEELVELVGRMVRATVADTVAAHPRAILAGLGVAVPDLVDSRSGVVRRSPTIGLTDFPLRQALRRHLAEVVDDVHIDNDANLAALAEHQLGEAAGVRNLVYLTGSMGIGGGIISDGRLLRGSTGYAGEVGHMVVDPDGPVCPCGRRGCWEAACGVAAFLAAAAGEDDEIRDPKTPLDKRFDVVSRRAADGDVRTLRAVQAVGRSLGLGLSNLINIFNPDAIVLGGYFARLLPYLIEPVRREVHERVMAEQLGGCRILASALGMHAGAIGAAHSVVRQLLADPSAVAYVDGPAPSDLVGAG